MKKIFAFIILCIAATLIPARAQDEKLLRLLVERKVISSAEADSILKNNTGNSVREDMRINADNKLPALKDTTPLPKIEKIRDIFSTPYAKLAGFAQFFFQASDQNLNPAAAGGPVYTEFLVRQAVFWAEGRIAKNFNYMFGFDASVWNLDEVYMEWVPADFFGARFGQFKVPFTLENPSAIVRLESAGYTRSVAALAGINGDVIGKQTGRDFGFQVSGNLFKRKNYFLLQYWAGLFQGTGTNKRENNNTKDFAGTLVFQPIAGLRFGASMYAGQAFYVAPGDTEAANHVRNRWSVGVEYLSNGPVYARSEWIRANDGGIDKEALYGTVTWRFVPGKWETFVKADRFNTDKSIDAIVTEYTAGLNFYIARLNRVQLNYVYSDYSATYPLPDANKLVVQLQLFF